MNTFGDIEPDFWMNPENSYSIPGEIVLISCVSILGTENLISDRYCGLKLKNQIFGGIQKFQPPFWVKGREKKDTIA